MVSTIDDDEWTSGCLHWHCESWLFSVPWRPELQWRHICSRLIWVGKGYTFHWYANCGNIVV